MILKMGKYMKIRGSGNAISKWQKFWKRKQKEWSEEIIQENFPEIKGIKCRTFEAMCHTSKITDLQWDILWNLRTMETEDSTIFQKRKGRKGHTQKFRNPNNLGMPEQHRVKQQSCDTFKILKENDF